MNHYPELAAAIDAAYLNTGAAGPMPRCAFEVIHREAEHEYHYGRVEQCGKPKFFGALERLRKLAAGLIGSKPAHVAVTGSTSEAINIVLWGLSLRRGDHILTTAFEHLGGVGRLSTLCKARGVEASFYEPLEDEFDLDAFFALSTPRTRLIVISHVSWTSGRRIPIEALCRRAHEKGILVLVDSAQAVGAIPIDVTVLGVDFYAFPAQKWLLGPEGVGFLYVAPNQLTEVAQTYAGAFSFREHDRKLAFIPKEDCSRFEVGTRFRCLLEASAASLVWLDTEIGWDRVLSRTLANAKLFQALLSEYTGLRPVVAESESGLVAFELPKRVDAGRLVAALDEKRIYVRTVPGRNRIRASTAFFNTREDFCTMLDEVRTALRAPQWPS